MALRSYSFDNLQNETEVCEHAVPLIEQLNGALRVEFPDIEPLPFSGRIGHIDDHGTLDRLSAMATGHARGRARVRAVSAATPPQESTAQRLMKAAKQNSDVATALHYFGQPTNWFDMWTTYETIENAVWRSISKHQRPKGTRCMRPKRVLLMNQKWVSGDDLCTFTESCNYHRHGAIKSPTSQQSSTQAAACQTLAQILRSWLNSIT